MKYLNFPLLALLSAAAVSCATPHPHRSTGSLPSLHGQLVDSKSNLPLSKVPVQLTVEGQPIKRTTNSQGHWRVPLLKIHHDFRSSAKIAVDCPGYYRKTINWSRPSTPPGKSPEAAGINLGVLRLEKR